MFKIYQCSFTNKSVKWIYCEVEVNAFNVPHKPLCAMTVNMMNALIGCCLQAPY